MFKFSELKNVELEITNRCQASCPMCPRNINGGIDNPSLKINDWTIDDFIKIFNKKVLEQISSFLFCGSFGEPVLNNDLLKMCQYIQKEKPDAFVMIHSNGSLRKPDWWADLAKSLPEKHQVLFAIDGVDQYTHSRYRIGTDFDKILENAKSFIDSGGKATWSFLRFKHNQEQTDAAEELAKKIGFSQFSVKDTRRFAAPTHKVLDSEGNITHLLEPITVGPMHYVDKTVLDKTFDRWSTSKSIYCYALNGKSVYIDAHFTVLPCCILSSFLYTSYDESILKKYNLYNEKTSVNTMGKFIKDQVFEMIDELGGFESLDARNNGIKNIIETETWKTIWEEKWKSAGSLTCSLMCSSDSPFIPMQEQFTKKSQISD